MLPLFLDARNRQVVVIGGGLVGQRKAAACSEAGFAVRVVDPLAVPWPGVEWIAEAYRPAHLDGASIVVAAATPPVNAEVVADARRASVLVCDAANPEAGDFTFPAVLRRGQLVIAVSTGGASPTLGTRIRDQLRADFGPEYAEWVAVLDEVRQRVLEGVLDAGVRRRLLAGFAEYHWLDRLRDAGPETTRKEMLAVVAAAAGAV
jgi:precorrin-2 dehydrogenase / sirohydrochlorin ferrochelatase